MTDISPLRQLQLAELDELKETVSFFDKNNIVYYAIGGTLLGAVRHNGFIPWDDDIDLGLPRDSYERLLKLHEEGKCPLNLVCPSNDDNCYWYPARVESPRLKVRRFVHEEETVQNVWIDLFPLDGVPGSKAAQKIYWWKLSYRRFRFNISRLKKYEAGENRIMNLVKRGLMVFIDPEKMDKHKEYIGYDRQMKQFSFDEQPYFINGDGRYKMREIAPKSWLGVDCFLPFEDIELRCIEDYDRYLTRIYGDYMKKPDNPEIYEHRIIEILEGQRAH